MKIMFLHLSDLHLKKDSQINLKIDKIISSTQPFNNIDKCVLICSGDLAFSGKEDEYNYVRSFFGAILTNLEKCKNQFIETYLVPGNHDMILSSDARTSADILSYFKNEKEDHHFNLDLKLQDNFFKYAKSKNCFVSDKKVVDSHISDLNGYKIQYNLVNTAPFSTLKHDNKEIHYLPDSFLYSLIKKENVDLAITIMHHGTEWFHQKTKIALEKMLCGHSDIVFQGHEHNINVSPSNGFFLSKGGEFSGTMTHKSTFSIIIFDTESNICENIEFKWDDEKTMFIRMSNVRKNKLSLKSFNLKPDINFTNAFFDDLHKISNSVLDYFVFPKLYENIKKSNEDEKLLTEENFWEELLKHKVINISGKSRSGKTTLLKYLFNKCIDKKMLPLYIGNDSCRHKSSMDKIIKNNFEIQYGEDAYLYEKFEQTDKNKKIIFIDDLDLIKLETNQKKLIEIAKSKVELIIFTSKKRFELDVKHMAKEEIIGDKEYFNIKIEDFYKEKRNELINKICDLNKDKQHESLEVIIDIIDNLVKRRFGLFELSPEYIVQYVKFFLKKTDDNRKGEAVFNVIFETNIRNAIIEISPENYVEYCLLTLEEIAFYMHKNKNERILYQNIVNIIDEINTNRGLKIDIGKCFKIIFDSKIIKKYDDENRFEFTNRNYLAYFIAKKLNRLIEKNGLGIPEVEYIYKNICFGINDNIMLFLSFLRDNTNFALNICNLLESIVSIYPELNFDEKNISFLNPQHEMTVKIPTENDKKEMEKRIDSKEKQLKKEENEEIQFRSVYDYNENDAENFPNIIYRSIKYLEIISKSLISHNVNFDLSEKKRIIELMYSIPNRILYALFKPYDQQYSLVIDELLEIFNSTDASASSKISREDVEEIFFRSAIIICLNIYDNVAFFGSNSDTLFLLNEFELKTKNNKISNLIMEENGGTSENFVNKAIKLKESEKDSFITNLIRMITRKHLVTRNVDFKNNDRIADKIFSSSSKKEVLSVSYKGDKKNR